MDQSVNNPHDKFVKEMLSDRDMAIAFLDAYLPPTLRALLNLDKLEYANIQFITSELQESFSDIVFKIPVISSSEECYISLVLENKSVPDKYTSFQLLGYLSNGYLTQIKNKETIHPIIPVVYYQGKRKWKMREVGSFFDALPPDIQGFIPTFDSIFVSLMEMSEESLFELRNGMLYSAIALQKYRFDPVELEKHIERIFSSINPLLSRNFIRTLIVYTLQVTDIGKAKIIEISNKTSLTIKNDIMSTYDQLIREGELKGKLEGKIEGKLEGKLEGISEVIIKGFESGISVSMLANITGMPETYVNEVLQKHDKIV